MAGQGPEYKDVRLISDQNTRTQTKARSNQRNKIPLLSKETQNILAQIVKQGAFV
jgi:hypothetical protein